MNSAFYKKILLLCKFLRFVTCGTHDTIVVRTRRGQTDRGSSRSIVFVFGFIFITVLFEGTFGLNISHQRDDFFYRGGKKCRIYTILVAFYWMLFRFGTIPMQMYSIVNRLHKYLDDSMTLNICHKYK